jgi:hypothetical protein
VTAPENLIFGAARRLQLLVEFLDVPTQTLPLLLGSPQAAYRRFDMWVNWTLP